MKIASLSLLFLLSSSFSWHLVGGQTENDPCQPTMNSLAFRETYVQDFGVDRIYKLCPNTRYDIGNLDFDYRIQNGQDMMPLRPNLHIKCGDNGNKDDRCFVNGGDIQLDGTAYYGIEQDTVENVIIEGITFFNVSKYMVWINKPGSIVFKNCEFRDNDRATTLVLLDHYDPENRNSELSVKFIDCIFENNQYAGAPAQPALVVANSRQNRLIFEKTEFIANDMATNNTISERNSYLVETSGPLTMIKNCFSFNVIGVSPVAAYGTEHLFVDNFEDSSRGLKCPFASRFETSNQFDTFQPLCSDFDSAFCQAREPPAPTATPTSQPTAPTSSPTNSPTITPTFGPTSSPRPTPATPVPTTSPTSIPTTSPTSIPTTTPSSSPTLRPSSTPSLAPSAITPEPTSSPTSSPDAGTGAESGAMSMPKLVLSLMVALTTWLLGQ